MANLSFRISVITLSLVALVSEASAGDQQSSLQGAVGRVLCEVTREYVTAGGGSSQERVVGLIRTVYWDEIRELNDEARVDFFLNMVMHVDLDGSFQYELHEMIAEECAGAFYQRATLFLESARELYGELWVKKIAVAVHFLENEKPRILDGG